MEERVDLMSALTWLFISCIDSFLSLRPPPSFQFRARKCIPELYSYRTPLVLVFLMHISVVSPHPSDCSKFVLDYLGTPVDDVFEFFRCVR